MDCRIALAVCCLAVSACAHAPRRPAGGETISLDTVELRVPDEPGWRAFDRQGPGTRVVRLEHVTPAGEVDRRFRITECWGLARDWTPEGFLAHAERATPLHEGELDGGYVPGEPFRPDDRFGPRAVRRTVTAPPRGPKATAATTATQLVFVPLEPLPSRTVTAWEGSADGTTPVMDSLRLVEPVPEGTPPNPSSDPDVLGEVTMGLQLGAATSRVQGQDVVSETALLTLGLAERLPRTMFGLGFAVDAGVGVVGPATDVSEEPIGFLVEASASLIFHRLRLGVGLERDWLGAGSVDGTPIDAMTVTARRSFATVDITSRSLAGTAYVGVEGTERGGYTRFSLVVGGRLPVPSVFNTPAFLGTPRSTARPTSASSP